MENLAKNNEKLVFPSLWQAFWYWLKLGFVSFGGPAGQIAIMHHDLVEQKRWISDRRFLYALNYCMLLPGPEAQQLATYIGWLMHGKRGGLIAGGLFVLPSLLILTALGYLYMRFSHLPALAALLAGIKPAIVAIVLFAAYRIGKRSLKHPFLWGISVIALLLMQLQVPFVWLILGAAALGWGVNHFYPAIFSQPSSHHTKQTQAGAALIDDETPAPLHAKFSLSKTLSVLFFGLLLGLGLIIWLNMQFGWAHISTQMAWFFSKAALLTFGGAYAVLPYVTQASVSQYGWLNAQQMMDGLALGETTPGPLIMIVTFVGFVGGWLANSSLAPWQMGAICAFIATFFTFLPSFIFIFAGAPLIESTKQNLKLQAPLTAITAAVIGVIISLALYFAQHLFWVDAQIQWLEITLASFALVLLVKFNWSIIKLIALFAALGLLRLWF